ncbi:MAG TPA: hypothetical protein RMH99_03405 [Sandaracinaceae bacterium LLY-WYZ-13_1]|nr:hypothetical protein [Sandaracinaceae bacterium LLY-WYZ-13_1]
MTRYGKLAILTILAGCSSGLDSGVQGDKPVSALDTAEATDLCEATVEYLENTVPASYVQERQCTIRALSTTTTPTECEADLSACLEDPPSDDFFGDLTCDMAGPVDDCNATVDAVEACWTADTEIYKTWLDEFTCDDAGNLPVLMELRDPPPVPQECIDAGAMGCDELTDGLYGRGEG